MGAFPGQLCEAAGSRAQYHCKHNEGECKHVLTIDPVDGRDDGDGAENGCDRIGINCVLHIGAEYVVGRARFGDVRCFGCIGPQDCKHLGGTET